ncbi:MAG TPA: hypothetical protein VE974_16410 [Thermoanaerobaculia bacterium]|nr:hypothetical protein [Thermoanaerobaculia bacterium]
MSALPQETTTVVADTIERGVTVTVTTPPSGVGRILSVDPQNLFINVPTGQVMVITYTLTDELASVVFDNPPLTITNNSAPISIARTSSTTAQMAVDNTNWQNEGASYFYTIRAIWTNPDNVQIPISLDPTVHNDPPG